MVIRITLVRFFIAQFAVYFYVAINCD